MKPAWDSLAQQFAKSDKVFVGDVDCTASGKELCERIGVQGFPTIKYFNPPDTDGESMTPEPQRSSTSAPDGLRVVSDLVGDDPDASCAAYDLLIG